MGVDADWSDYLQARWPLLVAALEAEGVEADDARLAVAEALLALRRGWRRLVAEENVDVHVWQAVCDRTGLPARPGQPMPVTGAAGVTSGQFSADGPEPWLERAEKIRRGRRARSGRRYLVFLAVAAAAVAGLVWWASAPDVREAANPLPVIWYAGEELHLADVVVELPDVDTFVAFGQGAAVRRVDGEVVQVDGAGEVSSLDDPPEDLTFAPDLPDYLPFGRFTTVVQGAPFGDGGWAYVLDSRRGTDDALRLSDSGQRILVLCNAAGVCHEPEGGLPAEDFRLR